ncbi:hypothetical protein GCM10027168_53380 [Streptomyces capparidis]
MSAVSKSVTPWSSAARTARKDSSPFRRDEPYAQLMGMHPSPTAPTTRADAPIVLRSTRLSPPHCPSPAAAPN